MATRPRKPPLPSIRKYIIQLAPYAYDYHLFSFPSSRYSTLVRPSNVKPLPRMAAACLARPRSSMCRTIFRARQNLQRIQQSISAFAVIKLLQNAILFKTPFQGHIARQDLFTAYQHIDSKRELSAKRTDIASRATLKHTRASEGFHRSRRGSSGQGGEEEAERLCSGIGAREISGRTSSRRDDLPSAPQEDQTSTMR